MSDIKVTVRENGPLRLEGAITIHDESEKQRGLAGRSATAELAPPPAKASA
jgi:hypothetical protein